jgi:phage terminase large subunit-like protein
MGQAKNRGTYEQRVAQARQREADRIAAAKAAEAEQVRALVMKGEDPDQAVRIVRSGGHTFGGRGRLFAAFAAALALGSSQREGGSVG